MTSRYTRDLVRYTCDTIADTIADTLAIHSDLVQFPDLVQHSLLAHQAPARHELTNPALLLLVHDEGPT